MRPRLFALCAVLPTIAPAQDDAIAEITFEPYELRTVGGVVETELGRLRVPECHAEGTGEVELAFVRFRSTADEPGPPIVYLAGGPSTSGIETARGPRHVLFEDLRAVADVIALDQRGVGMSRPRLECDHRWQLPLDRPLDLAEALRAWSERAELCREHWEADGVDLGCYDTLESVADLEALRRALGVEEISLWGISYGTHLGLAAIRKHPERIHRAVLAGVEGPSHTLKLPSQIQANMERIHALVAADPVLSERVPDFLGLVHGVLADLEREPVTVPVGEREIVIGKTDIQLLTAGGMGSDKTIRLLPAAYRAMAAGDWSRIAPIVAERRSGPVGSAMRWAMDCASGVSAERLERIERESRETLLGGVIDFPLPDLCDAWRVDDLGDAFRSPVRAEVPVLFISGTLDGRTPPSNAEEVRADFPRSAHLVIEGAAHSDPLFLSSPRIGEVIHAFLEGEDVPSERVVLPPIEFVSLPD